MNPFSGETLSVVQIIQLMLAPAVMISACGLLLLSINNKYSLVVNRIRLLNEEKRKYSQKVSGEQFSTEDSVRLEIIAKQVEFLLFRVKLVKNSVLAYTIAVALFVLTSLSIGLSYFAKVVDLQFLVITTFLIGMIFLLLGVVYAGFETKKGYDIILFEVKAHD